MTGVGGVPINALARMPPGAYGTALPWRPPLASLRPVAPPRPAPPANALSRARRGPPVRVGSIPVEQDGSGDNADGGGFPGRPTPPFGYGDPAGSGYAHWDAGLSGPNFANALGKLADFGFGFVPVAGQMNSLASGANELAGWAGHEEPLPTVGSAIAGLLPASWKGRDPSIDAPVPENALARASVVAPLSPEHRAAIEASAPEQEFLDFYSQTETGSQALGYDSYDAGYAGWGGDTGDFEDDYDEYDSGYSDDFGGWGGDPAEDAAW